MKQKIFFSIAIRIIITFTIFMLGTFIPELLRDFFGDNLYVKPYSGHPFSVDDDWAWGVRHYFYYWMVILLFILSLINIVMYIIKIFDKE